MTKSFARMQTNRIGRVGHASCLIFGFALTLLVGADKVLAFGPPSVESNEDGIKHYKAEEYDSAFQDFAKSLSRDSYNPSFHFNLGDAFYKNGELPKALSEFEAVEKSPKASADLKFKAMFNAGNVAIEAKDINKALQYYQRALDYKPDSKETKTNIELALKDQEKKGGQGDNKDKDQKDQDDKKRQNDKKDQPKDDKDKKDGKDPKDQKQNQNQNPNQGPTPRPSPRPFQSQALNENDVRRILDELKRQEEQIRAKQYKENKDAPERQIDKDW